MLLQTLSENWQIRPLERFSSGIYPGESGWLPAQVPGHWQEIPGLESHVGKAVYRCGFPLDAPTAAAGAGLREPRFWLRINGAFYRSRPFLNGVDLGGHEGYFIPCEREVTDLLEAENRLLIELECPEERDKLGKTMITGVFSHWDCLDPLANPGGIWLPVELHASGPVRLRHARCLTLSCDERAAQLRFDLDLDAAAAGPATLRLSFRPRSFPGEVQVFSQRRRLRAGPQRVGGLLKLRDPRLWWSHDLGRPDLYDLRVEVLVGDELSDQSEQLFGVRRFELRDWVPHLNGVRFLAKGNNYPPGDMRIARMTRARFDADLELAKGAHMNMLRIHAHVDHPALYDAADEAGVLLWQDFPLQWAYDRAVLPEALRQAEQMVRLLGGHPSIALWCMHNESLPVEDTADESLLTRLRSYNTLIGYTWTRDVLDTRLKAVAEAADTTRPVIRSSGELAIPYLRQGTDSHAYFGWYRTHGTLDDIAVLSQAAVRNLRFVTEFGAQSFPNLESSLRFMPERLDDATVRRLVARHGLQDEIMGHWLPWREAASLAEVVDLTQEYQSFINRYYIDRLRYYKYRPTGGIIAFLLVDPYPAVLWSVIDYWRVPKRSYAAMRTALSPQYAFCLFHPQIYPLGEPIELPIYAVNDAQRPVGGARLVARLRDPAGAQIGELRRSLDLPADCEAFEVERLRLTPTAPGEYRLEIELWGVDHALQHAYIIEAAAQ